MTTSSARPDYLHRYAMLITDRSSEARLASTRAAVALAAYRSSSPDVPVTADASSVTDQALARSEGMLSRVHRIATAFSIADQRGLGDHPVAIIDEQRFGWVFRGALVGSGWSFAENKEEDGVDRSGWHKTVEGDHTIGPAEIKTKVEVLAGAELTRKSAFDLDRNGLDASVELSGFVGARLEADATLEAGVVTARGHVEASVGAEATAGANARINLDEVHVDASAGAFAGARAGVDAEVEAMGVGFEGEAEVRAGIGADVSGEGHLGWDKVGFEFSGGLALGLGAGGSGGLSVNPRKTVSETIRLGARLPGDADKIAKAASAKATDVYDDGIDLAGDAYRGGRQAIDDGIDFIRNPLGNTATVSMDLGALDGRGGR